MQTRSSNALAAVLLFTLAPCGAAQSTSPNDPRVHPAQRQELQERERANQDARIGNAPSSGTSSASPSSNGSGASSASRDVQAARARLLKLPPLAPEKNVLLGRWQMQKPAGGNANSFAGMLALAQNPCAMLIGDEPVEFQPKSWASGTGRTLESLGPVEYRAEGNRIYVLPAKGVSLLGFDVVNGNRIKEAMAGGDCQLARLGAAK